LANKLKILVIYDNPVKRVAVSDLVFCFKDTPDALCYYYSIKRGKLPNYIFKINFDLIIFQVDFMFLRWVLGPKDFKERIYPLVAGLKDYHAVKIILPQDEFIHTDALNDFINEFNINIVYSVTPESEFPIIYNRVDFNKAKFFRILTGYISDHTLKRVTALAKNVKKRSIDIGYRATAVLWLGKIGELKGKIGNVFNQNASRFGLKTNISTKKGDTFFGDDWYKFLLDCKYVIGVESGATLLDRDGSLLKKCIEYQKTHPNAGFEELEEACFKGLDGNLQLFALSPRHLEAAMTRTCQVLVEGDYSGVFKPSLHYIPLKKDLSNLDEVLQTIKDDKLRGGITERTYDEIVASGKYSYGNFIHYITDTSMQGRAIKDNGQYAFVIFALNSIAEWWNMRKVRLFKDTMDKEIMRRAKYNLKTIPYSILIKLGMSSLKKTREAIRY
jgi:hypothetical protein